MILAVDLGRAKTGLATSQGTFASPYKTVTHKSQKEAAEKVAQEATLLGADKIVVSFTEGKNQKFFENFAKALKEELKNAEIILWDESLTTRHARETMIKLQVPKMKKKEKEHQVAASHILESYLDSIND